MTAAPSKPMHVRQQRRSTTADLVDCKSHYCGRILSHNHSHCTAVLRCSLKSQVIYPTGGYELRTTLMYFHSNTALD